MEDFQSIYAELRRLESRVNALYQNQFLLASGLERVARTLPVPGLRESLWPEEFFYKECSSCGDIYPFEADACAKGPHCGCGSKLVYHSSFWKGDFYRCTECKEEYNPDASWEQPSAYGEYGLRAIFAGRRLSSQEIVWPELELKPRPAVRLPEYWTPLAEKLTPRPKPKAVMPKVPQCLCGEMLDLGASELNFSKGTYIPCGCGKRYYDTEDFAWLRKENEFGLAAITMKPVGG